MKIKFNSDGDLPLNKRLKFHEVTIIIRSVFEVNDKLYPQLFFRRHFVWVTVKMLRYEKISASDGVYVIKTSASKECILCHYWWFKDVGFKFEPHVYNKCHDLLMAAYELKNIAILNVKGVDFRCIFWGIRRDEAVNRLNNSVLEDKSLL